MQRKITWPTLAIKVGFYFPVAESTAWTWPRLELRHRLLMLLLLLLRLRVWVCCILAVINRCCHLVWPLDRPSVSLPTSWPLTANPLSLPPTAPLCYTLLSTSCWLFLCSTQLPYSATFCIYLLDSVLRRFGRLIFIVCLYVHHFTPEECISQILQSLFFGLKSSLFAWQMSQSRGWYKL